MNDMLQDPMFLYAVCFFVFLALVWVYGRKPIVAYLDAEILKIRKELDEAQRLRAEAEALLADAKAKQSVALAEAETIVTHAKREAVRIQKQAEAELETVLAKHEQQAVEHIRIEEARALDEVRAAAVELAIDLASKALGAGIDETAASKLADQAIADVSLLSRGKAKAA